MASGGDMMGNGSTGWIVSRYDDVMSALRNPEVFDRADVQAAADSPRWYHEGSSQSMGEDAPNLGPHGQLNLESGVPQAAASLSLVLIVLSLLVLVVMRRLGGRVAR